MEDTRSKIFSPKEAARATKIGEHSIREAIRSHELRAIRIGNPERPKKLLILEADLWAWVENLAAKSQLNLFKIESNAAVSDAKL